MSSGAYGGNRLTRGVVGGAGGYLGNGLDHGSPAGAGGTDGGGTVVAQWIFDEASGNVVDEVGGISVGLSGTATYRVETPQFKLNSTGISLSAAKFGSTTDHAALAPGTSDFVLEISYLVNAFTDSPNEYGLFDTRETTSLSGFGVSISTAGSINIAVYTTDGVSATASWSSVWTSNTVPLDQLAKIRIVVDRSTNPARATAYYNGTNLTAKNLTGVTPAKSIGATAIHLGGRYDAFRNIRGIMKEVRLTTGTKTANSGGKNGG